MNKADLKKLIKEVLQETPAAPGSSIDLKLSEHGFLSITEAGSDSIYLNKSEVSSLIRFAQANLGKITNNANPKKTA